MDLTATELMYIDRMFNDGGDVLDFSDASFAEFSLKSIDLYIKAKYGLSKVKSLNRFFSDNSIDIKTKMKLLKDLLEIYEVYKESSPGLRLLCDSYSDKPKLMEQYKEKCVEILEKHSGIILETNTKDIKEKGLKELIEEAQEYYKKDKKIATEKLWDALERLKTYYMKEGIDKKKSVEKIIEQISHSNETYYTLFNDEFIKLTDLGNKHRIRHHELDKIEIIDDNYYDYFYNRCLALIDLALKFLSWQQLTVNVPVLESLQKN